MTDEAEHVVPTQGSSRRKAIVSVAGVAVAAVLLAQLTLVLAVPQDAAPVGDAVIVHAGGRGERIAKAMDLMEEGAAPTLVVMYLGTERYPDDAGLCGQVEPFEVLCPAPHAGTTIGEAREVGALVEAQGWDRIVIVTTDYHVRRAKLLVDRCTDAEVGAAAGGHRLGFWAHARRVSHEMAGLLQAYVFCC